MTGSKAELPIEKEVPMTASIESRIAGKLRTLSGEITVACDLDSKIQAERFSGLPIARL